MDTIPYTIVSAPHQPELQGLWEGPAWRHVPAVDIANFRPESSAHRPLTQCKMLYSPGALYGLFRVQDRYVRCVHTTFQSDVYEDSCVEFFVQPKAQCGYFNFEFNGGGTMLASYVTDPTRVGGRIKTCIPLACDEDSQIRRYHSLPQRVEPEITDEVVWFLEFAIPLAVLENYVGPIGDVRGQVWRANFHKCGDDTSHPHWATWAPVDELNFHVPASFGSIRFKDPQRNN